jgi:DNA-directed RNA polymerase subunit L
MVEFNSLAITYNTLNIPEDEMMEVYGITKLPLCTAQIQFNLHKTNFALANAIRRVLCDELQSFCLTLDDAIITADQCSDPFMFDQVIRDRIQLIPLMAGLDEETATTLRFELDVSNNTHEPKYVYSGDLHIVAGKISYPIFNPTFEIVVLQPGKFISLKNIHLTRGIGRDNAVYQSMCQTTSITLDIPEYDKTEMEEHEGESGYKISTLMADPHHFLVSGVVPAIVPNSDKTVKQMLQSSCQVIVDRLQRISAALISSQDEGVIFVTTKGVSGNSESLLVVKGETHTIGNLLRKMIYDNYKDDISFVGYTCFKYENAMKLTVVHPDDFDCKKMFHDVIELCVADVLSIKSQISA